MKNNTGITCMGCVHDTRGQNLCLHPKAGEPGFWDKQVMACYEKKPVVEKLRHENKENWYEPKDFYDFIATR